MSPICCDGARFIWRGRDITRYGDLGDALCSLETEEDAAELWNTYIEFLSRPTARLGGKTPQEVAGSNIGYLMGYYGDGERRRVYALFPQASHPIFGHDFGRGADPTPAQAVEAGKRAALGEFDV
jgi:hypothetical protein